MRATRSSSPSPRSSSQSRSLSRRPSLSRRLRHSFFSSKTRSLSHRLRHLFFLVEDSKPLPQVRLIGYSIEGSLFLVYEYIENGNLSQHLRGAGSREPLPWATRVQIALDSARGLEYIHEHTVPVADFGLTKLTEVGSSSLPTGRLVGTFGYMPPEYAQYGDVSPKVDVYAFGVVLYELISAKEAIVKTSESEADSKGLVALFDGVLSQPDPTEDLCKLVDPRLGDNYPIDSVRKMAQLAKACTQDNPQLRPSMRSIVVALMTLSSTTDDWDVGSFYENQNLVNLMSGR
ncbi:hypothetical protein Fmac_026614 [Flemingia macrophylla]|uniref:Protein kinase domain-containing protein n=1 Tax=Flemingia macrophylla TaxID=520843 RepID=A0ABD1LH34_9FABA